MEGIGLQIRDNGWQQGIILLAAQLRDHVPELANDLDCHLLVVSQSCDLVHHSIENEPLAVFLVAREIEEIDSEFANGLHPRRMHFAASKELSVSANAWEQVSLDRSLLTSYDARSALLVPDPQLRIVLNWLSKRYTRTAFPDTFNDQLRGAAQKIKATIKKHQQLFSDILLSVQPFRDLKRGEAYSVVIHLVMDEDEHNHDRSLETANKVAKRLSSIMERAKMNVVQCEPVSENDLTLAEFKLLQRWDYDYLTYREQKL